MSIKKHIPALLLAIVAAVLLAAASFAATVGENPASPSSGDAETSARARLRTLRTRILPAPQAEPAPVSRVGAVPAPGPSPIATVIPEFPTVAAAAAAASPGDGMNDALIEARVKNTLYAKTGKSSFALEVVSIGGVVSLSGQMPDRAHRDEAMRIARQCAGVRQVQDQMKLKLIDADAK